MDWLIRRGSDPGSVLLALINTGAEARWKEGEMEWPKSKKWKENPRGADGFFAPVIDTY